MIKKFFIAIVIVLFLMPFIVLGYYLSMFDYDISKIVNYNPPITTEI